MPEAAARCDLDEATLWKWVRRGLSKSAFRGPRDAWCFRQEQLDAELEDWRCAFCGGYALLSRSEPKLCKHHDAAVRRDGKLTACEFAEKHHLDPPALVDRLRGGEIPGELIERRGDRPDAWLVDEQSALAVLEEQFRCRWHKGCAHLTVSPTLHCGDHAGAAAAIANAHGKVAVSCRECGKTYEAYPSQMTRKGDLCRTCNLATDEFDRLRRQAVKETWERRHAAWGQREGHVLSSALADDFGLAPHPGLVSNLTRPSADVPHKAAHERVTVLGVEAVLIDREDAHHNRRERLRNDGRARAALNYDRELVRLTAARIVRTKEQRAELKKRFGARERWRLRLSPGRPPKGELHAQWARAYDEIAIWWRGRALDICLEIAKADHAMAPERWTYCPADEPERAKRKVDSAIRRHKVRA